MKKLIKPLLALCLLVVTSFTGNTQSGWPKEIPLDSGGKITIYQPQLDSLKRHILSGRAAVSIVQNPNEDPTFGAIWFDAVTETNKETRIARLESLNVKQVKFPGISDKDQLQKYTGIIQTEVPKWDLDFPLDQLLTSIKEEKQSNDPNLNNAPPKIIYTTTPSTLIVLDGQPQLQFDDNLKMQRVVNTPSLIVKSDEDNNYYFYGGGLWYVSSSVLDGWTNTQTPPAKIKQLESLIQQQQKQDANSTPNSTITTPTDVIVSTEPAELIQTEGPVTFQSIQGTSLLYADNSLDDIFKDINTQDNYILVAGRWYKSQSLNGPWTYVPSNKLPADFAQIPEGSEKDGVLANVAGTNAANEAIMDAQIPQTAKVDRNTATANVTYDGDPIFTPINNTKLSAAENSNVTVLKSGTKYYAVDNGVWYISDNPGGPWSVATERPADVDNIPADNAAYNTRYVYIYDYTPDYVFEGYTSGYLGSYIYGPTVVWGTGWHYRPWHRNLYYPRPFTWGFGMRYNPWSGWNIGFNLGFGLGWGLFDFGINSYYGGWFGPRAYLPQRRAWGWNGGYYGRRTFINRPNVRINRPIFNNNSRFVNNINVNRNRSVNLYNRVNGARTIDVARRSPYTTNSVNNNRLTTNQVNRNATTPNRQVARPSTQANNVVTDREGNVYRRNNSSNSWQQRTTNRQWQPAQQNRASELNRTQQQRERSSTRTSNFNQAYRGGGGQPRGNSGGNSGGGRSNGNSRNSRH